MPVCPNCFPNQLQLYIEDKEGNIIPIGQPLKLHLKDWNKGTLNISDGTFRIPKHRIHTIKIALETSQGMDIDRTVPVNGKLYDSS